MAILNSKKITALLEENEELKSQIREIYEKKWTKARLDEVLINIRNEIGGIKDEKLQLNAVLDNLKIEIGLLDYDSTSGTYKVHGGIPATNNKTNKIQPVKGRNSKQ